MIEHSCSIQPTYTSPVETIITVNEISQIHLIVTTGSCCNKPRRVFSSLFQYYVRQCRSGNKPAKEELHIMEAISAYASN